MDFSFTPEEEAFRDEVRAFLAEQNPNRGSKRAHGVDLGESEDDIASLPKLLAWNQALYERGWVGFSWPKEVGGGGGGLIEQMILKEEVGKARAGLIEPEEGPASRVDHHDGTAVPPHEITTRGAIASRERATRTQNLQRQRLRGAAGLCGGAVRKSQPAQGQ